MIISTCQRCGRCCTSFGVCVTIFDILRIVEASQGKLRPEDFVTLTPEPPNRERTEPAIMIKNKPYLLILKWKPGKDQECLFYDAKTGCLIYENRPILCRTYPFKNEGGQLKNMKSRACPCLWMPEAKSGYMADLMQYEKELVEFKKIVDSWNVRPGGSFSDFLEFALHLVDKKKSA